MYDSCSWSKCRNISTRDSSMKHSGSSVHVFELAFEWMKALLNTNFIYFWYLLFDCHMSVMLPTVDIVYLVDDFTKSSITIAGSSRFYWNFSICLQLDVTLLLLNSIEIQHCLSELWKYKQGLLFIRTQCITRIPWWFSVRMSSGVSLSF